MTAPADLSLLPQQFFWDTSGSGKIWVGVPPAAVPTGKLLIFDLDNITNKLPLAGGTLTGPLMQPITSNPFVVRDAAGVAPLPSWPNATLMGLSRDQGNVRLSMTVAGGTPFFEGRVATGNLAAPTAPPAAQALLTLTGGGYDGATWTTNRVTVSLITAAQWAAGNTPTAIQFSTTPANSTTTAERMRVDQNGVVIVNATAPLGAEKFRVVGGAQFDGLGLFGSGPVLAKPTVTGSRAGNAALTSLLTALAPYGFVIDATTA